MLARWTLNGSILATCAKLAALRVSAFHRFPHAQFLVFCANMCNFCTSCHAEGAQKCLFWNCSSVFACPPLLVPCGFPDFFIFFDFFLAKVYATAIYWTCQREKKTMPNKLAENKQRICFTIRRDLAQGGKVLAEKQGLTFSGLISHLLALALQKSKTE